MPKTELKQRMNSGTGFGTMLKKDFFRFRYIYLMLAPVIVYYILFCYLPMYGIIMGFQNYRPGLGMLHSPFASSYGLQNFIDFFKGPYFKQVTFNTLYLNSLLLLFGFPAPIIFALLINEMRSQAFKRITQTISYLPFFISMVVVGGMIVEFCKPNGLITSFFQAFGMEKNVNLLYLSQFYRPIYIISDIWQGVGFSSIIYITALTGINPELYEAAYIDGAGRWQKLLHITLPGISSTVTILFILALGSIMSSGLEKPLLLQAPSTLDVSDVISTYIYRMGILHAEYSLTAAVGLFNSAINFTILIIANKVSRKISDNSLF